MAKQPTTYKTDTSKVILYDKDGEVFVVPIDDILYLQVEGNFCKFTFYFNNKIEHTSICQPLKKCEQILSSHHFIRIHHSHLVNQNHLLKINYH